MSPVVFVYLLPISLGMQFSYPKNKGVMNKIKDGLLNNGSLKFEITAKRLYAASQRVL